MLINFYDPKARASARFFTELFALLDCLKHNFAFGDIDEFYHVARLCW